MKTFWENEGGKNGEGMFVAVVDLEDGSNPQRFMGATEKEVADKLLEAQLNATKALRKPPAATPAPAAPATVAVAETPEQIKERITRECIAFGQANPDYVPTTRNGYLLGNYCQVHGLPCTRENFQKAYDELRKTAGLLDEELLPTTTAGGDSPASPERAAAAGGDSPTTRTRPRAASSGLRGTDTSGHAPARTVAVNAQQAQFEAWMNLPPSQYAEKLRTEPEFKKWLDAQKPAAASAGSSRGR